MHFAVRGVRVREVLLHVLGQQVAAVAGGVNQHVRARCRHRAVEDGLERLVAGLAVLEAQVVAINDEFFGTPGHHIDDVGQVDQVGLVDLDEPQALDGVGIEAGLDQRRLAGAASAREQHVVGRQALHEMFGVALDALLLRLHFLQIGQRDAGHVAHGLQQAVAIAALAVAEGVGRRPVRLGQRLREHGFDAVDQGFGALQQALERGVHER